MGAMGRTMIRYLVIIIIVVGGSVTANARELVVGLSSAVTSLSSALKMAKPYDTLCVNAGTYHPDSTLIITKPLYIFGNGNAQIEAAQNQGIFEIRSDSVTIAGFTLQNVPKNYLKDLAAIWVDYSQHFYIGNNTINNCFFGIFITKSKNGIVENNTVKGQAIHEHSSANAIHLWYCQKMVVKNNWVRHHRDGIYLEFVDSSNIENNISEQNLRYGLHFMFSNYDAYQQNTFSNNGAGVAVMFSKFIQMHRNNFNANWGDAAYGLLLKEIYDGEITGNTFQKNTVGIFAEGANRIHLRQNDFIANGWALKIRGSAMNNEFCYNNFIGNSFDLATDARTDYNSYHHNYWEEYSGYDLNKDGLGDVPHRPVKLFAYLVSKLDESILLMRSSFIELLNFAEKVAPSVTPTSLMDKTPLMKMYRPA